MHRRLGEEKYCNVLQITGTETSTFYIIFPINLIRKLPVQSICNKYERYPTALYCDVLCFQLFKPLGKDEMIKVEEIEALSDKKRVMRARLSWLM